MMSGINSGEIRICGMPQRFAADISVGRLRFFGSVGIDGERSIVYFKGEDSLRRALALLGGSFFCGIAAAVCEQGTPDALLGALCELGTPYFLLPERSFISRSLEGRLALLDGQRGELIIDPQLETLCGYRAPLSDGTAHGGVRISRFCRELPPLRTDSCGVLCECDVLGDGGELLESALALSESLCTSSLAVILDSPKESSEEEERRFCDSAEAIFRAAVYGNMSLMLGGICSQSEAERAFALLHGCFCRLLKEGREFNGYIAKGVLISSPALLFGASYLPRCDLLCFEFSRLSALLTGTEDRIGIARSRDTLKSLWESWRAENETLCRSRELRAICSVEDADELFWDWVKFMNIKEVYIEGEYGESFWNLGTKNS